MATDVSFQHGGKEHAAAVRAGNCAPPSCACRVGAPHTCRVSGRGALVVEASGARSFVTHARAESPLKLLTPKNHGDACWVFAATYGGGLVDGDAIALAVELGARAAAFLSTQASTKVYRSPRGTSQSLDARVGEGALLASVPDPLVCFAGARYAQSVTVELAAGASVVLVDALTCGRAARGERWDFARYASRTTITREGRTVAMDAVLLDPEHGPLRARMRRFDALATAFAFGRRAKALRDSFLAAGAAPGRDDALVVASPLGEDGAVLRVAGTSTGTMLRALREALAPLGGVLGDDPFARKW
jgi:urease accessory protein